MSRVGSPTSISVPSTVRNYDTVYKGSHSVVNYRFFQLLSKSKYVIVYFPFIELTVRSSDNELPNRRLTSQDDKFHSTPVTNSFTSLSGVRLRSLTRAGIPPALLIAFLFSSFCLPYDRFLFQNTLLSFIYSKTFTWTL
jgi:hypothetical protein